MVPKLLIATACIYGPVFYAVHTTAQRWARQDRMLLSLYIVTWAFLIPAISVAA